MGRVVFDADESLIRAVRQLIERGRYASIADFLWTAAHNQLLLEDSDVKGKANLLGRSLATQQTTGVSGITPSHSALLEGITEMLIHPDRNAPLHNAATCVPVWGKSDPIWGQINRIFPCKVGVRVLANMTISARSAVRFDVFLDRAAEVATALGRKLQALDVSVGRKRDEAYSVGLPTGKRGEANLGSSLERFKNHFLVSARGDRMVDGALARLSFVGVQAPMDGIMIALTEAGWQFAQLLNPILDGTEDGGTLSQAERDFYVGHVVQHVPAEAEAMALILRFIADGINDPTRLNTELARSWQTKKWSLQVISTQRSGLSARMFELGLLAKRKSGIQVTYTVTEAGREFLVGRSG